MAAAPRARPDDFFNPDDWRALSARSRWRGLWLVLHCWGVIGLAMVVGVLWPVTIPLGVLVVGARQLGLFILMHDAAHGLLHPNRRLNDWVAHWLCSSSLHAYRPYHLQHHRYVQQAEDPDLPLSAPFPISRGSLRRKLLRDLSGQTFFKQRLGPLLGACRAWGVASEKRPQREQFLPDLQAHSSTMGQKAGVLGERRSQKWTAEAVSQPTIPKSDRLLEGVRSRRSPGSPPAQASQELVRGRRFLIGNALGFAMFALAGYGWLWLVLWLLPMASWLPLVSRVRNIAEHALVEQGQADPLRQARTTQAGWVARALLAPYWVNFHGEHHLFTQLPCWQLPRAHALLRRQGATAGMEIQPGYAAVLALATQPTPAVFR